MRTLSLFILWTTLSVGMMVFVLQSMTHIAMSAGRMPEIASAGRQLDFQRLHDQR
jgi:hypothetical protein